ncbi:IMPACT-like, partial [Asbolus verrucosus]
MDNLREQCEEIEALNSIYGDCWKIEVATNSYSMQVTPGVKLFIILNPDYPSSAPPKVELLAPTLNSEQKRQISEEFCNIYKTNSGGPILYQWIEKLKEIVDKTSNTEDDIQIESNDFIEENIIKEVHSKVTHGDIIQDRKSVFQGHVSPVQSPEDTKVFMNYLLENKKIAQATHNISAYRILTPKGTILQDCDDDGESHAGGRVLHLLQILNLNNIMVVVSR